MLNWENDFFSRGEHGSPRELTERCCILVLKATNISETGCGGMSEKERKGYSWQKHRELQLKLSRGFHCPKHWWPCHPQGRVPSPGLVSRSRPLCFPEDHPLCSSHQPPKPTCPLCLQEGAHLSDFPHRQIQAHLCKCKGTRACELLEGRVLKFTVVLNITFLGSPCKPDQIPWEKYIFTPV